MHRKIISLTLWLAMGLMSALSAKAQPLELHGTLEQGALVTGKVAPGTRVLLDGKKVRIAPSGVFALGFDRDAKPQAVLTVVAPTGTHSTQTLQIKQREYDIQRVTGVPQQTVEPPPEQLQRILEEQKLVERARAVDSDREDFVGPFAWPLQGPISGVYGSQRFYNGVAGRPHFGVDVAAPVGTQVRAPADATVTLAQPDLFFSGGTLIMDHGYGVSSTFMHLSRLLVKSGEQVRAGQVVAEVGATGRASGPHLDWRINWFNVRLDPQTVVEPMPMRALPSVTATPIPAQTQ
ncbi:MAG TPA: M23 family metallopeptidase [Spongiibacteraceae bacterium]|nr:M23 family metallopeptidase [Spongiibacteraceae bacterium]